jgi:hypothetical protein
MHSKITQNTVHDPAATALPSYGDADYWFALIDEREAAVFLDLTDRTLQTKRQKGGGPKFVRVSGRCVKYRRIDCYHYSQARLRASTSDPGPQAAAAQTLTRKPPAP